MIPIQIASIDINFELLKNKIELSFHPIFNKNLIIKKTFEKNDKDEYTSDIGKIIIEKGDLMPDKELMDNIAILTVIKCIDEFTQNDKVRMISDVIRVYSQYAGQKIKIKINEEELKKL